MPTQRTKTGFNNASASFSGGAHDHRHCVKAALADATTICTDRKVRLTELRKRILELVWESHAPVGAYEILSILQAEQGRAAPPTVYRALEFLLEQGLIHRIEGLNAYVGCAQPSQKHAGQFLICSDCGSAAEVHDPRIEAAITRGAAELGFAVNHKTVEVLGLCPLCQQR